ncbi:MAG: hypothetical protein ACN6I6_00540 [bacterium]
MVISRHWCLWILPIGLFATLLYLSGPQSVSNRYPAGDDFEFSFKVQGDSPGAKALAIFRAQENLYDAIYDQPIKASKFNQILAAASLELSNLEASSKEVLTSSALISESIERSSDYKVVESKLLAQLSDQVEYNYTLLQNGELRISKTKTPELAIDNTQELIAKSKKTSTVLASQDEQVLGFGTIRIMKNGKKHFAFATNGSEASDFDIKQMISNRGLTGSNIAIIDSSTDWGLIVYKYFPHLARFQKIKKQHMALYLEGQFNKWKSGFAYDELLETLDRIIDREKVGLDSDTFKFMKEQRKQAAILRNGFYSYTKSGKAPKDFDKFTKRFGKLNDALQAENVEESSELARAFKKYILTESKIRNMQLDTEMISASKLEKRMSNLAKEIAQALEYEELPSYEFHKMRKQLKLFLQLTKDIRDYQNSSSINDRVVNDLDHIVTRLGDWHDTHISHKLQGFPVLETFSINAVDRRLIRETMASTTELIMPGKCSEIFGRLFH